MQVGAAALSYGLGALAFTALAIVDRRRHSYLSHDVSLRLPAAITAMWAALSGLQAWLDMLQPVTGLFELGRDASWLWFLHSRLRQLKEDMGEFAGGLRGLLRGVKALLWVAVVMQAAILLWPAPGLVRLGSVTMPLLLSVAGLVLVEQYYRNTLPAHRWGIKFLCMGLGGMFAYDFYMYAEGLLFGEYSNDVWTARGAINALMDPKTLVHLLRCGTAHVSLQPPNQELYPRGEHVPQLLQGAGTAAAAAEAEETRGAAPEQVEFTPTSARFAVSSS